MITLTVIITRKFWRSVNLSELFAIYSLEFRVWCCGLYCRQSESGLVMGALSVIRTEQEKVLTGHSLPRKESLLCIISITV